MVFGFGMDWSRAVGSGGDIGNLMNVLRYSFGDDV